MSYISHRTGRRTALHPSWWGESVGNQQLLPATMMGLESLWF